MPTRRCSSPDGVGADERDEYWDGWGHAGLSGGYQLVVKPGQHLIEAAMECSGQSLGGRIDLRPQ